MTQTKVDLDRIRIPTRVVVHRATLSTSALTQIIAKGEITPQAGEVCELEVGGQVIARGRIVRRWGSYVFKVVETGKEVAQ